MTLPICNARLRLSQGQLFWRELGGGQTLVFLHGAWRDGNQWLPWMSQLHQRYHCVAVDLLGFGESERPKLHYSIELEVECLAELLEMLKLRQVCLIGDSIGAWIAVSYALRFPEQVKALVLLEPEGVLTSGDLQGVNARWRMARWLTIQPAVSGWLLRSLLPIARVLKCDGWIRQQLEFQQQLQRSPVACKLLFARRAVEIQAEGLRNRLPWLKLPVLLLQSEQDSLAVKAANQVFAAEAPSAQVQKWHGLQKETIEAIDQFLQKSR